MAIPAVQCGPGPHGASSEKEQILLLFYSPALLGTRNIEVVRSRPLVAPSPPSAVHSIVGKAKHPSGADLLVAGLRSYRAIYTGLRHPAGPPRSSPTQPLSQLTGLPNSKCFQSQHVLAKKVLWNSILFRPSCVLAISATSVHRCSSWQAGSTLALEKTG